MKYESINQNQRSQNDPIIPRQHKTTITFMQLEFRIGIFTSHALITNSDARALCSMLASDPVIIII